MADALRAVIASGGDPFAQSRESLAKAICTPLNAGAADASLRTDVAPADVIASLSGVSLVAGEPEQRDQPAGCSTCSSTACATTRQHQRQPMAAAGKRRVTPLPFNRGP